MPAFAGFKGVDHFYNVSFHELTHWTGHKSRLDRDLKNRFGSRTYAAEELIAELGAAFAQSLALTGTSRMRATSPLGLSCCRMTNEHSCSAQSGVQGRGLPSRISPCRAGGRAARWYRSPPYPTPNSASAMSRSTTSIRGPALASKCFTPTAHLRHSAEEALVGLVGSPARLFTDWLAYRAVCYELRSISPCHGNRFGDQPRCLPKPCC